MNRVSAFDPEKFTQQMLICRASSITPDADSKFSDYRLWERSLHWLIYTISV